MKNIIYSNYKQYEWRRITFTPEKIDDLKKELISYMANAFYQVDGKVALSKDEQSIMLFIFNWLVGNGPGIDIKLNKGLFLTGPFGTGKTVILKGIIQFIHNHYSDANIKTGIAAPLYMTAYEMVECFRANNEYLINRLKNTSIVAIDDIGYEQQEITVYGTKINPLSEIIYARNDKGKCILLSTNKSIDEIGIQYGWNIFDRIKQMTYMVQFKGESKRF